jgi:hypothetical protein
MSPVAITSVGLPNGLVSERGVARLSVFLSPRLQAGGDRLDGFEELADWPAVLRAEGVRYVVQIEGQNDVEARVVSAPPRSDLWQALFRPETFVRERSPREMASSPFVTYPVGGIAAYVKDRYQAVGASHATALPTSEVLAEHLTEVTPVARRGDNRSERDRSAERFLNDARDRARGRRDRRAPAVIAAETLPEGAERDFTQFELFYHRPVETRPMAISDSPERRRRLVDFHEALTSLGDHPALLRQLGLVVDVEVDSAALPETSFSLPGTLRARPMLPIGAADISIDAAPVAYVLFDAFFCTAGRRTEENTAGDEIQAGMVLLGNGAWELLQFDVEGAASKTIAAAASATAVRIPNFQHGTGTIVQCKDGTFSHSGGRPGACSYHGGVAGSPSRTIDDPGREGLAALRNGGLTLVRAGTAHHVQQALVVQEDAEAGTRGDEPFFAEDVTRGYRLDVFEARVRQWRSLHACSVAYTIAGGPPIEPVSDEGFVRRAVTQPAVDPEKPASPGTEVYVHEALCSWQGWSLSAPRPGKAISRDPRAPAADTPATQPQRVPNEPVAEGLPLAARVDVQPGTLPRLRFGEAYRVRLRTVDLAGNSLSPAEADEVVSSFPGFSLPAGGEERYLRFEPLSSPELVARAEVHEGESLARMVIRSDHDKTTDEWAAEHDQLPVCERHVVPPKTSQLMAEQQGRFDAAMGTGVAVEETYRAARKEKGKLSDAEVLRSDGTTVEQQVTTVESPGGDYVVNREAQLLVPYLPDPLAAGVTILDAPQVKPGALLRAGVQGLVAGQAPEPDPGAAHDAIVIVPFGSPERWPEVEPFLLQLAAGDGAPSWDPAARVLVVRLLKGGRTRLRLSCHPPEDCVDDFAVRRWVAERLDGLEGAPPGRSDAHAGTVALGRAWTISPAREVELVHAVQRPVRAPAMLRMSTHRGERLTFAYLGGEIRVHGASTDRLDLVADWTDPVDHLDEPGPRNVDGSAHVFEVPIHLERDAPAGGFPPGDPDEVPPGEYDEAIDLVRLLAPDPDDQSGHTFLARHEFGDTRHRMVRYRGIGTSRFREYFNPELTADPANISRESARAELSIPSSARPAAPRVVYIVPAFRWERGEEGGPGIHVSRRRGGLRIYLDRPWHSSGTGELLGVVLWSDVDTEPPPFMQGLVTRWGRDPVWRSPPAHAVPAVEHFPDAVASASGLPLEELREMIEDVSVTVAGHQVTYDDARRLWFCDLAIDAGASYTPFVRLALARWQPNSIFGVELSGVVLADFAQLAPDRGVTVVRDPDDRGHLDVSVGGRTFDEGPGPLPPGEESPPSASVVEVAVERRLAGSDPHVGWTDASDDPGVTIVPDAPAFSDTVRWSGRVHVDPARGPYRVTVREFESFAADADQALQRSRRLVFAETIEV